MKLDKILVGVDFSPESEIAVKRAMAIARRVGAQVVLVHIGPVPERPLILPEFLPDAEVELREQMLAQLEEARRELEDLWRRVKGQGVEVSNLLIDDVPHDGLVRCAHEIGADLLVVGTHGRTGIKRFALGSVAERVVREAPTAVLVARAGGSDDLCRILVPVDFSDWTERALAAAVSLAPEGGEVVALHAWHLGESMYDVKSPVDPGEGRVSMTLRATVRERVQKRGAELVGGHGRESVAVSFQEVEASPRYGIQDWLENEPFDLVVMATHGRRGMKRLLMGSVAESTVRHAPCSVLVVR